MMLTIASQDLQAQDITSTKLESLARSLELWNLDASQCEEKGVTVESQAQELLLDLFESDSPHESESVI